MEQSELLRFVAGALEKLGIPYFVTGSDWVSRLGLEEVWQEVLRRS